MSFTNSIQESINKSNAQFASETKLEIQASEGRLKKEIADKTNDILKTSKEYDIELYNKLVGSFNQTISQAAGQSTRAITEPLHKDHEELALSLKSCNSAISEVSTQNGTIIKKMNEHENSITRLNQNVDKIINDVQALSEYCRNKSPTEDNTEVIKEIQKLSDSVAKISLEAMNKKDEETIGILKSCQDLLDKMNERELKICEEKELIKQEKAKRRELKDKERLTESEKRDQQHKEIMAQFYELKKQ